MLVRQVAINAGFDFRRYAMKPMLANPKSIIAQVDGSGTLPEVEHESPTQPIEAPR